MALIRSLLPLVVAALVLLLLLQSAPTATAEDSLYHICEGSNYTANSSFQSNLQSLLASLSTSDSSFFTDIKGDSDKAYGLVMCRGDVDSNNCTACIKAAAKNIPKLCVQSKQAIVWYDYCQLRYSDVRFFSSIDGSLAIAVNNNNSMDPETFAPAAKELMGKVADFAAHKSSSLLFATGIMKYRSDLPAIYGLGQCTRDLSADVCSQCLHESLDRYWNSSYAARIGGRILGYSCNFRYEAYAFFNGDPIISLDTTISPAPATAPSLSLSPAPEPSQSLSPAPALAPSLSPSPSPPPSPILSPPPNASNCSHPPTPTVETETESKSGKGNKKDNGKVLAIVISSAVGLALIVTL